MYNHKHFPRMWIARMIIVVCCNKIGWLTNTSFFNNLLKNNKSLLQSRLNFTLLYTHLLILIQQVKTRITYNKMIFFEYKNTHSSNHSSIISLRSRILSASTTLRALKPVVPIKVLLNLLCWDFCFWVFWMVITYWALFSFLNISVRNEAGHGPIKLDYHIGVAGMIEKAGKSIHRTAMRLEADGIEMQSAYHGRIPLVCEETQAATARILRPPIMLQ